MMAELEAELAESMEAADNAADKIADLEQQLVELGATINAGNHVPPNTRVLRFTHNPIVEDVNLKRDTFERLRRGNKVLVHRLGEVLRMRHRSCQGAAGRTFGWKKRTWLGRLLIRRSGLHSPKLKSFARPSATSLASLYSSNQLKYGSSAYNLSAAITFQLNTSSRSSDPSATMKLPSAGNGEDPELTTGSSNGQDHRDVVVYDSNEEQT